MAMRALPISRLQPDLTRDAQLQDHALDLRFDLGRFDSRITFTRSSTATYFDADGILKVAATNAPRIDYAPVTGECKGLLIEEARTNLLMYSQDFDSSAWAKTGNGIASNVALSPDGTLNADKLVEDTSSGAHHANISITKAASATTYTLSAFAKAAGRSFVRLRMDGGSGGSANFAYGVFNLSTGSASGSFVVGGAFTAASGTITHVGDGWYRLTLTATTGAEPALRSLIYAQATSGNDVYIGDGTSGLYLWGAQLETGAFATSYVPSSVSFTGRASPATYFDAQGVLRTAGRNRQTYSEQFNNAAWLKANASAADNVAAAPDGSLTASKIAETGVTGAHTIQFVTLEGGQYRISISLKAAERSFAFIGNSSDHAVAVDLVTGAISAAAGTPGNMRCEALDNGWWRVSFVASYQPAALIYLYTSIDGVFASRSYPGVAGSGVYAWGAQINEGAWEAPYVRTTNAAVGEPRYGYGLSNGQWVSKGLELEAAATNLLTYSEQFDTSAWVKVNASVLASPEVAPNGTQTVDRLIEGATSAEHRIGYNTMSAVAGTTYTASIYAKAGTRRYVYLLFSSTNSWGNDTTNSVKFDLQTGAVLWQDGTLKGSVEDVGGGWFRLKITGTALSGTSAAGLGIGLASNGNAVGGRESYAGDGAGDILIWGAQLEAGSVATSYIPTLPILTSRASTATYFDSTGTLKTAAVNEPRYGYGYVNGEWVAKGLELEAAATNLLTYSQDFDIPGWAKTRTSVIGNCAIAPDGTMSADLMGESNDTGVHYVARTSETITAGAVLTASVFVKRGPGTRHASVFLATSDAANGVRVGFDLDTGVAATPTVIGAAGSASAAITPAADGWFRLSVTASIDAVSTQARVFFYSGSAPSSGTPSYTGDGTSGLYLWGAQLETGTFATSCIPTTTAAVTRAADISSSVAATRAADVSSSTATTRAADVATMTGANFSSWFNATEGTFVASVRTVQPQAVTGKLIALLEASNNTNNERINLATSTGSTQFNFDSWAGGVNTRINVGAFPFGSQVVAAGAYKVGSNAGTFNNGAPASAAPTSLAVGINQLSIGNIYTGAAPLNGHIKRLTYYPRRLPNSLLQKATQ